MKQVIFVKKTDWSVDAHIVKDDWTRMHYSTLRNINVEDIGEYDDIRIEELIKRFEGNKPNIPFGKTEVIVIHLDSEYNYSVDTYLVDEIKIDAWHIEKDILNVWKEYSKKKYNQEFEWSSLCYYDIDGFRRYWKKANGS